MGIKAVLSLILATLSVATFGQTSIGVPRIDREIALSGTLADEAWAKGAILSDLTQASPDPGAATKFTTETRLVLSATALYVGVRCTDPQPADVRASALARDADMQGDDSFTIVLDTFLDGRTGYLFRVNAAGTLQDGLIDGGQDFSASWDGDWQAMAKRSADGWTCEMRIPLSILRSRSGSDIWGFNVERYVARERLRLRWTGINLNHRITEMGQVGRISGLGAARRRTRLAITPYLVAKNDQDLVDGHSSVAGRQGLDLRYDVSDDLSGIATFNTDFAETEVDERQIKLDRFPLFFPEKRRFFLEGADQFGFGLDLESTFLPFYSRRIGLFNGLQVPLDAGFKAIGRQGRLGIGALVTRMGSAGDAERTTLAAGRFTYDVDDKLRIGTISTSGSPDGTTRNRLFGLDATWRTSQFQGDKSLSFGGWWARTDGDVPAGGRQGWGLNADYPNDLWDIGVHFAEFGAGLDPGLGFISRPGQRLLAIAAAYQPRPKSGDVQQWFHEVSYRQWQRVSGGTVSRRLFTAPINLVTRSGDHYEFNIVPQHESVDEAFEIADGVTVPVGSYDFTRFRIQAEGSESRPFVLGETLWFGPYFGGKLTQWEHVLIWAPKGSRLKTSFSLETDWGDLPGGRFRQQLLQSRVDFAFDPSRTLSGLVQYDSESRDLGLNIRYRWQIAPGSDLFVVWNRSWRQPEEGGFRSFTPTAQQLLVKLTWTFRS